MAVAHDALGGSGSWNTATTVEFTHTPVGTPRGVAVLISQNGNGDEISAVTYGGVAMSRTRYEQRTVTETLAAYVYFLGASIPTGAQTVAITSTGTLIKAARSVSVTAATDTAVDSHNGGTGNAANPSLAMDPVTAAVLYYVNASGLNTPVSTPESGTTELTTQDLGSVSAHWGRKDSDGSATTIGWSSASDDFAHIAIAIAEAGVGAENVDLVAAALTFAPQALDPVSQVVNVDLTASQLTFAPQALSPVSGVVNVDLAPGTLTFTPQALNPVSGVANLDLVAAQLTFSPQALDPQEIGGVVNVDLVPVILTFEPQALDPVSGVVNVDLTPAVLTFQPQPLDPTEPTYRFFPPTVDQKPVGYENTLLLKGLHSWPISLRLENGVYVETTILVYERDILGKIEGFDYFVGGHRYTGVPASIAALLVLSGYTPEVES